MATTTKSKSTKKPAQAKKTAAAKKTATKSVTTTKKAVNKKVPVVKKVNTTKKSEVVKNQSKDRRVLTPIEKIRNINFSLTLLYAVFAGLVAIAVTTIATGMTMAIQVKDQFASNNDNLVLGPANELLFDFEPKNLLIASLVIGALSSVLLATKLRNRYELTLANRTSGFRWLITGVTSALLLEYASLTAGITDILVLKVSAALVLATALFAFIAERDNVGATKPKWLAYVISLFTGIAAWLPIAGVLIGTSVFGQQSFPVEVYAIAGVTFLGLAANAVSQYFQIKNGDRKDYLLIEARYWNIDMFTKFAVVLITLLAFK